MNDKYDEQAAFLTKHPEEIMEQWSAAKGMFQFMASSDDKRIIGCLTMIKNSKVFRAETQELTDQIRQDERIPGFVDIRPEHFPVFIEWQRKLDSMYPGRYENYPWK